MNIAPTAEQQAWQDGYNAAINEHLFDQSVDLLGSTTDFMRLAGQLDSPPTFDDKALRAFRRRLIFGEFKEYREGEEANDLVETVDGLLDMIVVAWGTILAYVGEEKAIEAASAVLRSNLAKVDGSLGPIIKDEGGKVLKPPGWTPPNIAAALGVTQP